MRLKLKNALFFELNIFSNWLNEIFSLRGFLLFNATNTSDIRSNIIPAQRNLKVLQLAAAKQPYRRKHVCGLYSQVRQACGCILEVQARLSNDDPQDSQV